MATPAARRRSTHANGRSPYRFKSWDEYFLAFAAVAALKSKDGKCQVGAVIVSEDHLLISTGFNGFARGVFDDEETLDSREKLPWMCHAEANAIWNAARSGTSVNRGTIYVTKFPCLACCNAIVQAGITRVYTHDNSYWSEDAKVDRGHRKKRLVLKQGGVTVHAPYHGHFQPTAAISPKGAEKWLSGILVQRNAFMSAPGDGIAIVLRHRDRARTSVAARKRKRR